MAHGVLRGVVLWALGCACIAAGAPRPHIVHIVADDLGYNDLGIYNHGATRTPNLDGLISSGITLSDYYTFNLCSPSRASMLSGRYPWGVGFYDMNEDFRHCIVNYTLLPEVLRGMGYATHAVGKWDVGMAYKEGFDTFLGYYTACTADYWYHGTPDACTNSTGRTAPAPLVKATDFTWANASGIFGAPMSGPGSMNGTYDRVLFTQRATDVIKAHDATTPLYLYIAFHNVHDACTSDRYSNGLQAPLETVELYENVKLDTWKVQSALTTELDYGVGNITQALKDSGLWNNTVLVFTSDNGGPLDHTANAPLRGGKATMWEGGFRVVSFINSPLLPPQRRGTTFQGLAHASDWYTTFAEGIAGGRLPAHTGARSPDGFNLWPSLLQGAQSPRMSVVHQVQNKYSPNGAAIRYNHYKLMFGNVGSNIIQSWPSPASAPVPFGGSGGTVEEGTNHCRAPLLDNGTSTSSFTASTKCSPYCLFHVLDDPSESKDLAKDPSYKNITDYLLALLANATATAPPPAYVIPSEAKNQLCADEVATGYLEPIDWRT